MCVVCCAARCRGQPCASMPRPHPTVVTPPNASLPTPPTAQVRGQRGVEGAAVEWRTLRWPAAGVPHACRLRGRADANLARRWRRPLRVHATDGRTRARAGGRQRLRVPHSQWWGLPSPGAWMGNAEYQNGEVPTFTPSKTCLILGRYQCALCGSGHEWANS